MRFTYVLIFIVIDQLYLIFKKKFEDYKLINLNIFYQIIIKF